MTRKFGSSWLVGLILGALAASAQPGDKAIGVAPVFAPVAETAPGGNAALFVGVNQFSEDKTLQSLSFAVNDAIAQAHLFVLELKLITPLNTYLALGGEPTTDTARTQLAELESAGVHRITAVRTSLLRTLQTVANIPQAPTDLLVVSLSSHGFEENGQPYVMPADGNRGFLEDSAVNLNSVEQRLGRSKADKRLLLVDACREKPTTEGKGTALPMTAAFRTALAAAEGQAVLASCDAGQISFENPSLGQGVFTYFLLEALRGKATADDRGYITLGAVSEYVSRAVQEWVTRNKPELERAAAQRPWFKGPKLAEQIPLAMDSGIQARQTAFKADVAKLTDDLRGKINRKSGFTAALYDRLADALDQTQDDERGRELLSSAREFADGKAPAIMFVAYLNQVLETPEQRAARVGREERVRADGDRQIKIAALLATAQANDNQENGRTALAALDELLLLEPMHQQARLLHNKIGGYYGPSKDAPWENSLGMKFMSVKGTAVLFSIWDTRVQDYQTFVTATRREWPKPDFEQGPRHPAVNVSWEDAKAFCEWLTQQERAAGRLGTWQSYRLPTDVEWSVAVGLLYENGDNPQDKNGKIKDVYPWGTQWPPPRDAGSYGQFLSKDGYTEHTSPVGSFAANPYGLFDMGGNVWQWCEDAYTKGHNTRVLRGGSWFNHAPAELLLSYRGSDDPSNRISDIGFRLVLAGTSVR